MKKIYNRLKLLVLTGIAAAFSALDHAVDAAKSALVRLFPAPTMFGPALRQGGFVLLSRATQGYPAGTIVELSASTEAALIQAGQASLSAGPPTPGNVSTTAVSGCAGIAAGQGSVTITNPLVGIQSIIYAVVAGAAADATLTQVVRVNPAAGSFTIYGNANATAQVNVDWAIINPSGSLTNPT